MKKISTHSTQKLLRLLLAIIITGCMENNHVIKEKALTINDLDNSVLPAENFYQYACGGWMKNNPLPPDKSRYGTFDQLDKQTKEKVNQLIIELSKETHEKGSIAQKIGDFYYTAMDTGKIEAIGITPLKNELTEIERISQPHDIITQIARFHRMGVSSLFVLYGSPDADNSTMEITHMSQGGLGMTDRDYYTKDDPRTKEIQAEYVKYITRMFGLMGKEPVQAQMLAEEVMQFETRLAQASMTRLERRDPYATKHPTDLKGLKKMATNLDWYLYFSAIGLKEPGKINLRQPVFFEEINKMIKDIPMESWKTYFQWNLLNNSASYLSEEFVNASFDFYGKFLSGSQQIPERWERVINSSNALLGEAIGKEFVEKHFPPEAKERMLTLVENLRKSLGNRITQLDWMSEETKQKALEKLAVINVKIGYPDKWMDFSPLEITRDSYMENVWNARTFHHLDMIRKIGKPVDKDQWFMNPHTVNAYYSPDMNEICFPAGILQPPFFYLDADDAVNYGAIGVVIGHEMTHGFDDKGRQYDKDGNLKNWWTEEDGKKFEARTRLLVDLYNSFVVLDSVYADGELSLGENIADLGGINIAYDALQMTQPLNHKISGFTQDERFFLAYAKVWANNITEKEMLRRTKEDVHSLGKYRVNGPLPNVDVFLHTFNIKEGDPMYLEPNERAKIW